MANPFFTPSTSQRNTFADLGMTLIGLRNQQRKNKVATRQAGLTEREVALKEKRFAKEFGQDTTTTAPATSELAIAEAEQAGVTSPSALSGGARPVRIPGTVEQGLNIDRRRQALAEQKQTFDQRQEQAKTAFKNEWVKDMSGPIDLGKMAVKESDLPWFKALFDDTRRNVDSGQWETKFDSMPEVIQNEDLYLNLARKDLQKRIEKADSPGERDGLAQEMNKLRPGFLQASMYNLTPATAGILLGQAPQTVSPGQRLIGPTGQIGKAIPAAARDIKTWVTPDGQIMNLPTGQLPPPGSVKQSTGMDIQVGPEGTTIRTGVGRAGGTGGVTRGTQTSLEKSLVESSNRIARLELIRSKFKPSFQTLGVRFKTILSRWREKAKGTGLERFLGQVEPNDRKLLSDYSDYKRESVSNLNLYIKEITGAQMSEAEADRLRKAAPDPGTGVFDGDSPTEFDRKLAGTIKEARSAQARYAWYLNQGIQPEGINNLIKRGGAVGLSQVSGLIDQRGEELLAEAQSKNPGANIAELRSMVKKQLADEFLLR